MKNLKKYNQFVNENENQYKSHFRGIDIDLPKRDDKYQFLMDICKKSGYEQTNHFFVKDLIEIGTSGNHKIYLNYLDNNEYDNRLSYWVVYNEKPDDLYGTSWDSGVIWEEDGALRYTEKHIDNIEIYPDFIDIIYDKIKSYSDLDKWCANIKKIGETSRHYHRLAIQNSYKKKEDRKELTWEEQLEWTKNGIEVDKLLNRYSHPYDEKTLEEMLKLGEEKYTEKMERQNQSMRKLLDKMDFEKLKNKK